MKDERDEIVWVCEEKEYGLIKLRHQRFQPCPRCGGYEMRVSSLGELLREKEMMDEGKST